MNRMTTTETRRSREPARARAYNRAREIQSSECAIKLYLRREGFTTERARREPA